MHAHTIISQRLILCSPPPLCSLPVFAGALIVSSHTGYRAAERTPSLLKAAGAASQPVRTLQIERGSTAGFPAVEKRPLLRRLAGLPDVWLTRNFARIALDAGLSESLDNRAKYLAVSDERLHRQTSQTR